MKKIIITSVLASLFLYGIIMFAITFTQNKVDKDIVEYLNCPAVEYSLCAYFMDHYEFLQMLQGEVGALSINDENLRKFMLCLINIDFPNPYLLDSTNIRIYLDDACTADIIELIETYPSDVVEKIKYNTWDPSKLTGSSYFAMRVPYYYDNAIKLLSELKNNLSSKLAKKVKILNYYPDKLMREIGYNSTFVDYEIDGIYAQFHFTKLKNGTIIPHISTEKESLYELYYNN